MLTVVESSWKDWVSQLILRLRFYCHLQVVEKCLEKCLESKISGQHREVKTARYSARGLKHFLHINLFTHFARKISRWLWVQERALLVLHSISLWEYTQKRRGLRKAQLEHSSHIVKVGVETTCLQFNPWCILKEKTEPAGFDPPIRWTMINS